MSNPTPKIEQIIESWINLVNQAMQRRDETLYHGYISANEDAIELLEQLGAVIKVTPAVWRWADPLPSAAQISEAMAHPEWTGQNYADVAAS